MEDLRGKREGRTRSRVSRAVWTMASAISTQGIRPENVADVYPYVTYSILVVYQRQVRYRRTLARNLRASCRALSSFNNACHQSSVKALEWTRELTLLPDAPFIPSLTITRVSSNSLNILASRDFLTPALTNMNPLGDTNTPHISTKDV